jgi:hypothetical protein
MPLERVAQAHTGLEIIGDSFISFTKPGSCGLLGERLDGGGHWNAHSHERGELAAKEHDDLGFDRGWTVGEEASN